MAACDWENPDVVGKNRESPHCTLTPYPDEKIYASCGPPVLEKYRLYPEPIEFGLSLRRYSAGEGDIREAARYRLPCVLNR